jgi:cytochrome c biogenesis DsbD-like protein
LPAQHGVGEGGRRRGGGRRPIHAWLLTVILPVLSALPVLASPPPRPAPAIGRLRWFTSRDGVPAGGTLDLAMQVTLRPGFHLNTHTPSLDFLIPTTLETEPLPGTAFADWIFPKGELKRFPFAEDPIQVYEGTVLIRGRISLAPDAAPGLRRTKTRLRFQACTKDRCYPPATEEEVLEFRVVPPGHVTRPQHADLFRGFRP